jgi:hypothetical protein
MVRVFLKIYAGGVLLLMGAIIINGLAKFLKLPSWYDFLKNPATNPTHLFWLFVVYPLLLGIFVYFISNHIIGR